MKIVFVACIIRNSLCIIYGFFNHFFQKSLFTENYFLIGAINLATRGPLYTCLVLNVSLIMLINFYHYKQSHKCTKKRQNNVYMISHVKNGKFVQNVSWIMLNNFYYDKQCLKIKLLCLKKG